MHKTILLIFLFHRACLSILGESSYPLKLATGSVVSTVRTRGPSKYSELQRQSNLQCPNSVISCEEGTVCCPGFCCEPEVPFCGIPFSDRQCLNSGGNTVCTTSDGFKVFGTPCQGNQTMCCATPGYDRCTLDTPYECVNEDGYVGCGEESEPGVVCNSVTGSCCINPLVCCIREGELRCCEGGPGPARLVEPLYLKIPGVTPLSSSAPETDPPPTPGGTTEPEPSLTEIPEESASESQAPSPSPSQSQASRSSASPTGGQTTTLPPTFSEDRSSGRACFPSRATVELKGGGVKLMKDVNIGDWVRVSKTSYSRVFMWTHRDSKFSDDVYIKLGLGNNVNFIATIGHLVYVWTCSFGKCERTLKKVEEITDRDMVMSVEGSVERLVSVRTVERITDHGLYNPQTIHGDIVVDGIVATCYTTSVPIRIAHSALSPLRALHEVIQYASGSPQTGI